MGKWRERKLPGEEQALPVTYTPEQVARIYHRSVDTVNRWVREGRLTAINTGENARGRMSSGRRTWRHTTAGGPRGRRGPGRSHKNGKRGSQQRTRA